jgi:hypothetical protein
MVLTKQEEGITPTPGVAHPRSFQNRAYFKRAREARDGVWRTVAVPVRLSWLQDNETELDILDYDPHQGWPAEFPVWGREV